jgi:4a-hydroxytetrahydrobiopterin dehydratase
VQLQTHDAKGVTAKDFALVRKIEDLLMWQPREAPGAVLEGLPDDARFECLEHD